MPIITSADKKLLDQAAKHELTAQNMYRYFANCARSRGFFGFEALFLEEAKEEGKHYQKVADFVSNLGEEVEVLAIPAQEYESDKIKDIFSHSFEAEVKLKEFYEDMYESTKDVSVKAFALDMVKIQVEAVGEFYNHLSALDVCGEDPAALLAYDGRFL
jgi:ferritin